MSDEEISEAAMEVLRRMFGPTTPEPVCALATKWGSDAYARGMPPAFGQPPQDSRDIIAAHWAAGVPSHSTFLLLVNQAILGCMCHFYCRTILHDINNRGWNALVEEHHNATNQSVLT